MYQIIKINIFKSILLYKCVHNFIYVMLQIHSGNFTEYFFKDLINKESVKDTGKRASVLRSPASRRRWPNVNLMLSQRLRRWDNIKSTLVQSLSFAGSAGQTRNLGAHKGQTISFDVCWNMAGHCLAISGCAHNIRWCANLRQTF